MQTANPDRHFSLKPRLSPGRIVGAMIFVLFAAAAVVVSAVDESSASPVSVIALCAVYALLVLYVPSRGDVSSIMTGETDERQRLIDLRAHWIALEAVAFTCIAGYLWEQAHDRSGAAFLVVTAVGVATYLGSMLVLQRRT